MSWKRKLVIIPEYYFRLSSIPAGIGAAASKWGLGIMILDGYIGGIKSPYVIPKFLLNSKTLLNDYNNLRLSQVKHAKLEERMLDYSQNILNFAGQIGENLTQRPLETIAGVLICGTTFYGSGMLIKYLRNR